MNALEVLDDLQQWVLDNHDHHRANDQAGEEIDPACYDGDKPYVNSLDLAKKISELRTSVELDAKVAAVTAWDAFYEEEL